MVAAVAVVVLRGPLQPERLELLELFAQIPHVSVASCSSYLKARAATSADVADMHAVVIHTNNFWVVSIKRYILFLHQINSSYIIRTAQHNAYDTQRLTTLVIYVSWQIKATLMCLDNDKCNFFFHFNLTKKVKKLTSPEWIWSGETLKWRTRYTMHVSRQWIEKHGMPNVLGTGSTKVYETVNIAIIIIVQQASLSI